MNFSEYQQKIIDHIYDLLVDDDENQCITLSGEAGSGKSSIARGIAEKLQEGWSVFFIQGVDPKLSPYLTWHIGTKLQTETRLTCGGELSFGINFLPVPLSMSFGGSVEKENYVLTPSEEALLSSIKKQSVANDRILFIADNYELWDIPSKQFLQKLFLPSLKLIPSASIKAILISNEKHDIKFDCPHATISIPEISSDNLLFILHQKGYSSITNTTNIRACAGNDLSLALLAASYYDKGNFSNTDFFQLMNTRCETLISNGFNAHHILEPLSIIDALFTKAEAAFFLNSPSDDEYIIEFQAEESLQEAKEQDFIVGEESFRFTTPRIREYFRTQISKRERLHHRKFSSYLKKCHSEDYYNRGKHLKASAQSNDINILREAWQLLFLAYARFASEIGWEHDTYNVIPEMQAAIQLMGPVHLKSQNDVLDSFLQGYKAFAVHNYNGSLKFLESINVTQLVPACAAERLRIMTLCYVQLANNPYQIEQTANELYTLIGSSNFCEDEQLCRASLALLEVYSDRTIDEGKVDWLKKALIGTLHLYPGRLIYEEFFACFNRKSAIYYPAIIAHRQSKESVKFYRNHNNSLGLYMALCNHAANATVCGEYDSAQQALDECTKILADAISNHYPSKYKVANNRILLSYMKDELACSTDDNQLTNIAQKAQVAFSEIAEDTGVEVSHVSMLNRLGLSILCNADGWQNELKSANHKLNGSDVFYQYFLHDLNFASAIIHGDVDTAKNELLLLAQLNVPLLNSYSKIFMVRRSAQEQILKLSAQRAYDAVSYHMAIAEACKHTQDPSCHFFGRGFLLSDLQFLSF